MTAPERAFRAALRSEWTKLWTVRTTWPLLLAAVVATVGVGVATAAATDTSHCPTPATCFEDTTKLSLGGVALGQAAVVVLAVLAATNEYGNRLAGVTLAATPRRGHVLAARSAVVATVAAAAGAVAVVASLGAGRALLAVNGFTAAAGYPAPTAADGPTLRAAAGTVAYLALAALLAVGVGTLARDTAGALTTVLALFYLFPIVAGLLADPTWQDRVRSLGPMSAGLSIQATVALDRQPLAPWTGLAVLAAYAAGALALGTLAFTRRDA